MQNAAMPTRTASPTVDKAQAAELRQRLRGLSPPQAEMMRQVMALHAAGERMRSLQWLLQLATEAPDHPEVRLWQGLRHMEESEWLPAAEHLQHATRQRNNDFGLWHLLGVAQGRAEDAAAAQQSFREAARCARTAAEWLKLSTACDQQGFYDQALQAAEALLRLQPGSPAGLLQRARCNKALGRADEAAADCRSLVRAGRETGRAWFSLVDLKTVPLQAEERQQLAQAAERADLPAADRRLLDFALGKALEDAGELAAALQVFHRANAGVRAQQPWDSAGFDRRLAALRAAFGDGLPAQAVPQGREVVFLVGLPRSGSTLVEQVLASHSAVEGASELPHLNQVIEAESRRRQQPLAGWAAQASAEDWTRLGAQYLQLSARWRRSKPIATDKLPDNWLLIGAIRAMLPQARIVDCRREALETCWSCYKQLFGPGLANFSYGLDSLAQYARACEAEGDRWAALHPQQVRVQHYEALVQQPEPQIRQLLDFCGLPFEAACLAPHETARAIRTPSALQVRQPMQRTSTSAARYGALLDPLRQALEAGGPAA